MFAKLRVQTECTSIFCQELMSVTTLTETLLKRSERPRAAIWENQRACKWASMFVCCVCTLINKNGNPGIPRPKQIRQGQASRAGKQARMASLNTGYWATLGKSRQVRYVPILEYGLLAARLSKYRQMALLGILE